MKSGLPSVPKAVPLAGARLWLEKEAFSYFTQSFCLVSKPVFFSNSQGYTVLQQHCVSPGE